MADPPTSRTPAECNVGWAQDLYGIPIAVTIRSLISLDQITLITQISRINGRWIYTALESLSLSRSCSCKGISMGFL